MAWTILIAAALLEPVWALAIERSDGFRHAGFSLLGVVAAGVSFTLLAFALRDLPIGTAYAVWVGIGAAGVAAVGILILGETASVAKFAFIACIVVGVGGLRFMTT